MKTGKGGAVYILTNKNNRVLYTGCTSNLYQRILQHKEKCFRNSFSSRYNCDKLVYYEAFHHIEEALARERQIKAGSSHKKLELINSLNPDWKDLFDEVKAW